MSNEMRATSVNKHNTHWASVRCNATVSDISTTYVTQDKQQSSRPQVYQEGL